MAVIFLAALRPALPPLIQPAVPYVPLLILDDVSVFRSHPARASHSLVKRNPVSAVHGVFGIATE